MGKEDKGEEKMLVIDRIEGSVAVIETENGSIDVPLSEIKGNPKEGDVLKRRKKGFCVDRFKTDERKKEIFDLQSSIFKKKK